ncbi:uncharacterized protein PpBr36_05842 [Pyricularia pennisetigena]|uniref:uncharacterized protein n=1 Tax=Pyricularia pennisetigena TaxID=1578925 RepID=UPI00114F5F5B|nr:uncharacterized protein PpBr36_05842 [Pyricularia pennisetigena]TLS23018.1 hypothetical protein PpBr36_05842 [Pyricularia pennisetigena]
MKVEPRTQFKNNHDLLSYRADHHDPHTSNLQQPGQPTEDKHVPLQVSLRGFEVEPAAALKINIMGLAYNTYLNSNKIYGCKNCKAHLSNHEDIISRNFRGQHGKAYLFSMVVNVETGEPNERNMTTGRHIVRDIICKQCKEIVGWKYDKAYEATEKYKEGKFILEAELLCSVS